MTKVCYYRNEYRLRAEGHAGAGEKGRDLICAAESILMMALERHVSQRPEMRAEILSRPGAEEIRCRPDCGWRAERASTRYTRALRCWRGSTRST